MRDKISQVFLFLEPKEKRKWLLLTTFRSLLSILDLVAIMAVGVISASVALFLTEGSDPNRVLEFAGFTIGAINASTFPFAVSGIVLLFVTKSVFALLITRSSAYFVATLEARAAKSIAHSIFAADLDEARSRSKEEIMYAIQVGSPSAFNVTLNSLATMVAEGTLFLLVCLGFFIVNPTATVFAVAYFLIVAFAIQLVLGRRVTKLSTTSVAGALKANTYVTDLVTVFRELSVLGLREKYIDRLYEARVATAQSSASQTVLANMPRYVIEASLLLGLAGLGTLHVLSGDIMSSASTLGVFLAGGFRLTGALLPLQSAFQTLQANGPRAEKALEILARGRAINSEQTKVLREATPSAIDGPPLALELAGVSYRYPGSNDDAISGVTIKAEPGSQMALVGPSGAGKSTLADLIAGVISPTAGTIQLADSTGVLSRADVIGKISYVPQKPGLVAGSIADNVALAVDQSLRDDSKVREALSRANILDVVDQLPQGIHTHLGNASDNLSGGQLQLIGMARALYSNPRMLIMDEATSALDAESESKIGSVLNGLQGQVTVILIAHRLHTIQHVEKVIFMNQGEVADVGTFKEIKRRNPTIAKLVELMQMD